jgi:hypothetical protein
MTEQQPYEVVGSFESAGNRAFRPLAAFIGGRNRPDTKVAMTAPVVQEAGTRPGRYVVGFVMPATYTEDTVPTPTDPRVRIRTVPEGLAAALRFSGCWSRAAYERKAAELLESLAEAGLEVDGPLRFARFDPPWTPWFLRRNEVVAPLAAR